MKILTRRTEGNTSQGLKEEAPLEIPNLTVAALSGILTAILTVANTASPVLKDWLYGFPKEDAMVEQLIGDYRLKLLKQALQNETPAERAGSIRVMISAGLLKESDKVLLEMPELPYWGAPDSGYTAAAANPTARTNAGKPLSSGPAPSLGHARNANE